MPRNKYPEETVQKILDVSLKLFLEKGYEETTILDIVDNLGGLTRGAFYHHFKSKEEVMNALGNKLFFDDNPFEKVNGDNTLNGLEKIKEVIKLQFKNPEQQKINAMSIPLLKNPRILAELMESNQTVAVPLFEKLFKAGMLDGSIKKTNAKLLSEMLILLTNFWLIPSVFPCTKQEFLEKLILTKDIFDGIGVPLFDEEIMEYCQNTFEKMEIK